MMSIKRENRRQKKIAHCIATGNSHRTFLSNNAEDDAKVLCVGESSRVKIKNKEQAKAYKKPFVIKN